MCHVAEFYLAGPSLPLPGPGAWIDQSASLQLETPSLTFMASVANYTASPASGRSVVGSNCLQWQDGTGANFGTALSATGVQGKPCNEVRPVACCNTIFKEKFAGYTVATSNGAASGAIGMNALCSAEFQGSHLCATAEFLRAHATTSPPAGGAWVDASTLPILNPTGQSSVGLDIFVALPSMGRLISAMPSGGQRSCAFWTNASSTETGYIVTPSYVAGGFCNVQRSLACCR